MKKIFSLLFILLLALSFAGCELATTPEKDGLEAKVTEAIKDIDFTSVTGDINLPTVTSEGVVLTYISTDPSVLTNDGKVTRGETDKTVTLVITATFNGESYTVVKNVTIKATGYVNPDAPVIPTGAISVEDAISQMANYTNGQVSDSTYTVYGKVTSSSYNTSFGSYTLYLEAPTGYTFQVYSAKLASSISNTYTATDALKDATIVVTGYFKLFENSKTSEKVYEISYIKDKSGDAYQSPQITSVTGGTPDQKTDPVDPTPSTTAYTPVDSVSVGTEYKYVVEHKGLSKIFFIEGSMQNTYYYKTTTTFASGATITLETATGGYYVKIGTKYANVTSDANHDTVYMETTAKTVWTFDATAHTMICSMNNKTLTLGCRSGETYETIRAVEFGKGHYEGYLTLATGGTTPVTPVDPVEPVTGTKTVSEIISIMANYTSGQISDSVYTVTGKVTSSSYNTSFGSYTLYLEAPTGYTFQVYSAKLGSGVTGSYTDTDALKGATIVVTGYLKLFSNSSSTVYEVSYVSSKSGDTYQSPLITSVSGGTSGGDTPSSSLTGDTTVHTVSEIIALMANMSNGELSTGKYTVKGVVESSTYDSTHDSYTMYLEAPNGKLFQVYSAVLGSSITGDYKTTDALKGEEVVVTGYLKLFYNSKTKETTYEIAYDSSIKVSPVIESISGENASEQVSYDTLAEMIEALNAKNYLLTYTTKYDYQEDDDYDGSYVIKYYFAGNMVKWTVTEEDYYGDTYDYTYYVVDVNDKRYGIYEDDNGEWAICESGSEDYDTYIAYYGCFYDFDFSLITEANLELVSTGKYKLAAAVKNQFAIAIAGDGTTTDEDGEYTETFNDVYVYVTNGVISKIEFTSLYVEHYFETEEYDEETYNCDYTYTLNFSKYEAIEFDLPEGLIDTTYGLKANTTKLTVALGTTLDEVKGLITLTYADEEGSKVLTETDYQVTGHAGYDANTADTYEFVYTYGEYSVTITVTVRSDNGLITDTSEAEILDDLTEKEYDYQGTKYNITVGMPSEGDVKVLVFPIAFTTYPVATTNKYTNYKDTLEKAFNGTSQDTGWESLKSYYQKASYGKLNITATILDAYETGDSFNKNAKVEEYDYDMILELLQHYDSTIDYSEYDANDDGYIDCLYIVYLAPYDENGADDSCWWAYTYEFYEEDEETHFDEVGIDFYMWFSYDFFLDEASNTEIDADINCVTVIHETGHALGLNDYYDYNEGQGPEGGLGGCDMMDYNQGDHNPWSKAILGWITPEVISGYQSTYTKVLGSFGSTGDCIVIAKNWNGTWFDEMYIIDYRTVDGLNAASKDLDYQFSESGVVIYHVDGSLVDSPDGIWYVTAYDNSTGSHKQIAYVEADGNNTIETTYSVSNSDLFKAGDSISNLKWYDGSSIGYTISVTSINTEGATVTVTPNTSK